MPASEFRLHSHGRAYSFSLADGNWFYFAGIWRPAKPDWPEAYATLTAEAKGDVTPYHDRQMAVVRREQRLGWLDGHVAEGELLHPLPAGSVRVKEHRLARRPQRTFAFKRAAAFAAPRRTRLPPLEFGRSVSIPVMAQLE